MRAMIQLAIPVVLTYLGQLAMQIVDMIAVGRVSPAALGGVALGSAFFYVFMVCGLGMLTGLDFLVAHAFGAGERDYCRRIFVQALILSTLIAIPLSGIPYFLSYHLDFFGVAPDVAQTAAPYLKIISTTIWPTFIFMATRQYMQAMGVAKPAMIILVAANILNAFFNYIFVFGHFGFPRWEAFGSGVATFLSRGFMCLAMTVVVIVWDKTLRENLLKRTYSYDSAIMRRLLRLGTPASCQMVLEVGAFSGATTLAARLSSVELSAHQIVLNTVSFTFMVPLGISAATAVIIGQCLGRNDPKEAARNGWRGIALGVGFMAFSAIALTLFPNQILGIYSKDPAVLAQGRAILFFGALFQIFDAIQVVGTGAMRGVADTKTSMIANFTGHWIFGLPIGMYLCFVKNYGLPGLWFGLSLGLFTVAATLLWHWTRESQRLRKGIIPRRVTASSEAAFLT